MSDWSGAHVWRGRVTRTVAALAVVLATHGLAIAETTVVWISMDGVRHDYLGRADTPHLDRLIASGAHTRRLEPTFPTLTFPSHVAQATGVHVREHGVPANSFYDPEHDRTYRYPPFANLLEAEPIWFTATRQGVRTAVLDWPLAHWQENAAMQTAHHNQRFDAQLSDRERLEALLEVWRRDEHDEPLRLLMTWTGEVDKVGHTHGPESPEVAAAVAELDALIGWFADAVHEQWQTTAEEGDVLYLMLTTDHGMSEVHTFVNPYHLLGLARDREDVTVVTSGNVSHVYLDKLGDAERQRLVDTARDADEEHPFVRIWQRDDLPERWQYDHPTRTGDLVAVLEVGYTFSNRPEGVTAEIEKVGGPRGMHGYDPADDPDMHGLAVFHRWPEPLGGRAIDAVHALQLHPTVAELLGIAPAEGARGEAVGELLIADF